MLQEATKDQLLDVMQTDKTAVVFFHTPLCGTCKLAERMINTVMEAAKPEMEGLTCDLNFMPDIAERYKIMSVPALLIFQAGELKETVFSFPSLEHIYALLEKYNRSTLT